MKILNAFVLIVWTLVFLSCGGETEEHKLLHQAADIHMEALKLKKKMDPDLAEIQKIRNNIQIQGRALSPEEISFTKGVEGVEKRLKFWDDNHVEVPGFEHEGHDHSGHDHSHDHSAKMQMPASDILIIQKEFKDSIIAIRDQIGVLLKKAPK